MAKKGDDAIVTAEDQQSINKFARMHQHFVTLQEEMKTLMADVQNLAEAADEVMLLGDEETVPLRVGNTFIHFKQDDINTRLESMKSEAEEAVETRKEHKNQIEAEMERLKRQLYGKFGDKINLESEVDD